MQLYSAICAVGYFQLCCSFFSTLDIRVQDDLYKYCQTFMSMQLHGIVHVAYTSINDYIKAKLMEGEKCCTSLNAAMP